MIARPCDGQPGRMCPSDCDVDCHFANATLDRVMNFPLRPPADKGLPVQMIEPENSPWDWIDRLGFWWACGLAGAAIGLGWGLGRFLLGAK